jgi:hypothetical protein
MGVAQIRPHAPNDARPDVREVIMFARKVAARLKPNSLPEFTKLLERETLPWLRTQQGFVDLITLAASDGSEVAAISFWDHIDDALAYNSSGYPQVLKVLGNLLDSTPYVKTFKVVTSTFQGVALGLHRESEKLLRTSRLDGRDRKRHGFGNLTVHY